MKGDAIEMNSKDKAGLMKMHSLFKYDKNGQTLIETALILILLLAILLGIAEFSRAWYFKNSLKNGVRQGARLAIVTAGISSGSLGSCPSPNNPNSPSDYIKTAVCTAPGVNQNPYVTVASNVADDNGVPGLNAGDTITVSAAFSRDDFFVIGNSPWPWPRSLAFSVSAVMRYE